MEGTFLYVQDVTASVEKGLKRTLRMWRKSCTFAAKNENDGKDSTGNTATEIGY